MSLDFVETVILADNRAWFVAKKISSEGQVRWKIHVDLFYTENMKGE